VVAVSDSLKGALEKDGGLPPARLTRIYNGVDLPSKFSGGDSLGALAAEPAERLKVGIIGSLEERKGHEVLLRSWERVLAAHPRALLVIAGSSSSGPENKARLEELARSLGVSESLRWLEFVRDVGRLYGLLDVVVMPSRRYESFGRVVVEAMGFERLVIASRVGGIPELIDDGRDGYLFDNGDDRELARLLVRALGDPQDRKVKGAAGRRKFESRFSADIMARNYWRVLHEARTLERAPQSC
jgi:glycosyltransferase involved in cell wall biosynthesis